VNLYARQLHDPIDDQQLARLRQVTELARPLLANLDGDDETEAARH
jgi:hypothetical protein